MRIWGRGIWFRHRFWTPNIVLQSIVSSRRIDELGINQQHQTWLFRGQNRDWPLVPPALRCDFIVRFVFPAVNYMRDVLERRKDRELDSDEHLRLYIYVQRRIEDLIVRRFAEVADRSHLHVPTDSRFVLGGERFTVDADELEQAVCGKLKPIRPPTSVVDALAQHHRVPTRLLDFSYSPYVAAYFAACVEPADEKERNQKKHEPMVIWAINYSALERDRSDLSLVVQPRSRIGYLLAQDGVFLFDKAADNGLRDKKRWLGFERKLEQASEAGTYTKFKIAFTSRGELQRRLLQFGVSKPSLMPSFDVVRKWTLDYYADHPESLFWLAQ